MYQQLAKLPICQKTAVVFVSPLLVIQLGSSGYYWIWADWSWQGALYMTLITVPTVGYGEVNTLSEAGRFSTTLLILSSFGVIADCTTMVVRFVVEGGLNQFFQKMRMEKSSQ